MKPRRRVFVTASYHTRFLGRGRPDFIHRGHPDYGARENPDVEEHLGEAAPALVDESGTHASVT